jgi:hypothetical protein
MQCDATRVPGDNATPCVVVKTAQHPCQFPPAGAQGRRKVNMREMPGETEHLSITENVSIDELARLVARSGKPEQTGPTSACNAREPLA